jgi:membrane-bound serine protease (ClpP class)
MKHLFIFFLLSAPWLLGAQPVVSISIDGSINPAVAQFIHRSIVQAHSQKASCLLIHLNTPGGLLESTRSIVGDLLVSPLPVIVYVSPAGAHAGSAGVFVTLAADLAVMAPGTNIGAAHPVGLQGGETDTIMNSKVTNDAAAFIRTIAEKRKRNLDWAEEAVRQSVSITATEALQKNIIDLIATTDQELLSQVDGKLVALESGPFVLHTRGAEVQVLEMGFMEKMLNLISDPNIAYVMMMLGLFGLLFELFNPGSIFPGIVGFIALVLAFYSLHSLPVNYAGLALIIFGIALFLLELKIASHGMLAIGGAVSLLLGSLMLIRPVSGLDIFRISRTVIIGSVGLATCFFLFVIGKGLRAQGQKPVTGIEGLVGQTGVALDTLDPAGMVQVHGELWKALSVRGRVNQGQRISVKDIKDLTLYVDTIGG